LNKLGTNLLSTLTQSINNATERFIRADTDLVFKALNQIEQTPAVNATINFTIVSYDCTKFI
jgi:hypothetical protein